MGKWILENLKTIIETVLAIFAAIGISWKWLRRWYKHYKGNRDQWRTLLMDVQAEQNKILYEQNEKLNKIMMQVFPNGGSSLFDRVDKVLDNQAVLSEIQNTALYLDTTPISKTNMKGECTFVNLAWLRMSGFNSAEEAKGMGAYRAVHPDDRERVKEEFLSAIGSGGDFVSSYRKINVTSHEVIPVTALARIVRNAKGQAVEVIGVLQREN